VPTSAELLAQAQSFLRAGHLADAETTYRQLLQLEPDKVQAHHGLGVALAQQGQLDAAVQCLEHAQRLDPGSADIVANLRFARALKSNGEGLALADGGRLDEAERCFVAALECMSDYAEAHYNLGFVRLCQGRTDEAVASFERSLALDPQRAEAHNNLGVALARQGKLDEAISHHRRAFELQPAYADAHYNLAVLLARQGRAAEAVAEYRQVISLRPDFASAHNNLAVLLADQDRFDEAIASYTRTLELAPNFALAHNNLGAVLAKKNRHADAVACYRRALQIQPDYAEAYHNLGIALMVQDQIEEAHQCYLRAIQLRPNYAESWYNLAFALAERNDLEGSAAACARALELKPDDPDAHFSLATALLTAGRFADGWKHYEWRLKQAHNLKPSFPQPRWQGEPLDGKSILLVCEQGFGDILQFIRYAPLVKQRGGRVIVECLPPLTRLVSTCEGIDQAVSARDPLPRFDVQVPLCSLPMIFQTTLDNIPANVPYLRADEETAKTSRQVLGGADTLKVGIAWQGNPTHRKDRSRSIPLAWFEGIARTRGIEVFSLQVGPGHEQLAEVARGWPPIHDLGPQLEGFYKTAALMQNLDLVITCDSAPAHLAGALGIPVWVALPFAADWRWMHNRPDSPWYPSMRLFRQSRRGQWRDVFEKIEAELAAMAAARHPAGASRGQAEQLTDRALELEAAGELDAADDYFHRAIQAQPNYGRAHGLLGNLFKKRGQLDRATRAYQRVLEIDPGSAEAMYSLGLVAREQERFVDAEDWCQRALAIDPRMVDARYTLGAARLAQNKLDGAEASFRRAIELKPDFSVAHVGLGFTLLAGGKLAEGWAEYEWRLRDSRMAEDALTQPRWNGEPLEGRTILLRCEQGFGDSLQFIRYAGVLKRQGATVWAVCRAPLQRIVATATGVDRVFCVDDALPPFDFYIQLISLPSVLGTTLTNIPAPIPYLFPDPQLVDQWRGELNAPGLKVGISWQADPTHPARNRSMPLAEFANIARTRGARVYSLQFGSGREQLSESGLPIIDLGDRLGDFHNTAAIVRNLDLVITCDSAPAHVAAAQGVPTWVALPFAPDWRWMLERPDSPWYPTLRLFRQSTMGDWRSVFADIETELAVLVATRRNDSR
jgi:tetratricopeptide (TPR) repeat protein